MTNKGDKNSLASNDEPLLPGDIKKVLTPNPIILAKWRDLTPISRRDFIFWIDSAKQVSTRARRIESLPSRLASGKRRPCCFAIIPMPLYKALSKNSKARLKWKELESGAKRDLVGWIENSNGSREKSKKIENVCARLALGKSFF